MKYQVNPVFFSRYISDSLVLLKQNDSYCFKLNETGSLIWERLKKPTDEGTVLKEVLKNFEVEENRARQDVESFLKKGIKDGFLIVKS